MPDDLAASLEWMVECTLATVEEYAMKRKPAKREFERQRSIAQRGLNSLRSLRANLREGGRVREVIEKHNGSVDIYADSVRSMFHSAA